MPSPYSPASALRPFSLVVALVSCGLGVVLAQRDGYDLGALAALVVVAGLLLQAGVNLINDHGDLPRLTDAAVRAAVRRNYRLGLLCFAVAGAAGLYVVALRGWPMLALCLLGLAGAFAYTTEPLNYKRRGLGVVLVFWLMGVLMVQGAYFAVSGVLSVEVFWHSLAVSCGVSLLLLSNELRDWEVDRAAGVQTLAVRLGFERAAWLYWGLFAGGYVVALVLAARGVLPGVIWLVLPLGLTPWLVRALRAADRAPFTRLTGRYFFVFGIAYVLAL